MLFTESKKVNIFLKLVTVKTSRYLAPPILYIYLFDEFIEIKRKRCFL